MPAEQPCLTCPAARDSGFVPPPEGAGGLECPSKDLPCSGDAVTEAASPSARGTGSLLSSEGAGGLECPSKVSHCSVDTGTGTLGPLGVSLPAFPCRLVFTPLVTNWQVQGRLVFPLSRTGAAERPAEQQKSSACSMERHVAMQWMATVMEALDGQRKCLLAAQIAIWVDTQESSDAYFMRYLTDQFEAPMRCDRRGVYSAIGRICPCGEMDSCSVFGLCVIAWRERCITVSWEPSFCQWARVRAVAS